MDKNIELYDQEIEVLNRIEELKQAGYEETDMYIITDEEESVSMLRGMTGVIIKEDDDSIWDRFKSFLSAEDSVIDAFNRMDISENDREFYYDQVKDGKILLYVDREYIQYYQLAEDGKFRPIIDPNISDVSDQSKKQDESLHAEEMSNKVREDLGLEQKLGSKEMKREIRDGTLFEEEKNRLK